MDLFNVEKNGKVLLEHYKRAQWVRSLAAATTKELVGPYYGEEREEITQDPTIWGNLSAKPNNLLNVFYMSLRPYLTGEQITQSVSPLAAGLDAEAAVSQVALDVEIARMNLAKTHSKVVDLAMVGGCAAYHICRTDSPQRVTIRDEDLDPGNLTISEVGIDDLILDTSSRSREEDCFRAARFFQSKQYLMDAGMFDPKLVEKMVPVDRMTASQSKGESNEIAIDRSQSIEGDDIVEGWNVVIRRGSRFYVGVRSSLNGDDFWLVKPYEWTGGGSGPIEVLNLVSVPGQAVGMSPLWQAIDIHIAKQHMGSKIIAMMLEADTKFVYDGPKGSKLAEDLRDQRSRDVKGDPNSIKNINIPGPTADMYGGYEYLSTEASNESMALEQLSGSGAPSKLATEVAARQGALSARVGMIQGRVNEVLRTVVTHVFEDMYADPMPRTFMGKLGGNLSVPYRLDPNNRRGKASMFRIDVQPFAPENSDPNSKRARFAEFARLGPAFVQGIGAIGGNAQVAVRMLSKQYNDPMIDDLLPTDVGQMVAQGSVAAIQNPRLLAGGETEQAPMPIDQTRSDLMTGQPVPAGAL